MWLTGRRLDELPVRAELDALAAHRGIRLPDLARQDVFVCGPDEWMQAVMSSAHRLGVPDE